jgi:hypothetical protein
MFVALLWGMDQCVLMRINNVMTGAAGKTAFAVLLRRNS